MPAPEWVVIPAQDEAATIGEVVAGASRTGARVVVVDDVSRDDTARLARAAGAVVLRLCSPLGAWGATQTGLRYVFEQGGGSVVCMDGDGQHPVASLQTLAGVQAQSGADVIIGADPGRCSWQRRLAWAWFRLVSGVGLRDLTSGFRCYGPRALQHLISDEVSLFNYQDLGVLLSLSKAGLRVEELPVDMQPRRGAGGSRIFSSWWRVGLYVLETTTLALAMRRRGKGVG